MYTSSYLPDTSHFGITKGNLVINNIIHNLLFVDKDY